MNLVLIIGFNGQGFVKGDEEVQKTIKAVMKVLFDLGRNRIGIVMNS